MRRLLCLLTALLLVASCSLTCAVGEQSASGVIYEIFVASFADSNGDGCGDLQGIIDKLDYIESLGISTIWLMPIHPSLSYHKYDVLDYCQVDASYGTLEDFDALVAACGARGISVMLDLVVNHTSSEHPWFLSACDALRNGTDSPYTAWYHFSHNSSQHPVPGTEDWYYEGAFGYHMPDLNLDNEAVRAQIADIMAFWQGHGVKGFRLDAVTSYYTGADRSNTDFLRFLNESAKQFDPDFYLVGEAWTTAQSILTMYESGIDSLFGFPNADQSGVLVKAASSGNGKAVATRLADYQAQIRAVSPTSVDAPFLTNHDIARVRGMLRSDVQKLKAAAMLYLMLPGHPTVYYGEELGMSGSGRDENKRLPMLWSAADAEAMCNPPQDADQKQRLKEGVDTQDADPDSLLNTYRQLIALRRQSSVFIGGQMNAIDTGFDSICSFTVTDHEQTVLYAANVGTEEITLEKERLHDGAWTLLGAVGNALADDGSVTLAPVSCILFAVE